MLRPNTNTIPGRPSPEPSASVHPLETTGALQVSDDAPVSAGTVNRLFVHPDLHLRSLPPHPALDESIDSPRHHTALDGTPNEWHHYDSLGETFRHSGWKPQRKRLFQALRRIDAPAYRLRSYSDCGRYVRVLRSDDDPAAFKFAGSYCHDRLCLPCANSRARILRDNLVDHVRGKSVRFLTLTLRANNQTLVVRTDRIIRHFSRLRQAEHWGRHVVGGAYFIEVTYSDKHSSWHIHIHTLIEGRYYSQKLLKQAWLRVTGDSDIVDIRPANDRDAVSRYVTKYVTKPIDSDVARRPHLLDEAIVALAGRRLCTTFGSWRGTRLTRPPVTGHWSDTGTLEDYLDRVLAGNDAAFAALVSAGMVDVLRFAELRRPEWRKPPPVTDRSPSQLLLFDEDTRCYPGSWMVQGP